MNWINYLFKQGKWELFGKITSLILAFFLNIIVVNNIPVVQYGKYQYFLSTLGIFSMLTIPDFRYSYLKFSKKNDNKQFTKFLYTRYIISLIFSVIAALIFFILNSFYVIQNSFTYMFVILIFPAYFSFNLIQSYFIKNENFLKLNLILITINLLNFILIGLSAYFTGDYRVMVFFFLFNSIIIHSVLIIKKIDIKEFLKWRVFIPKNQLRFTLSLAIFSVPIIIVDYFDKIMIAEYIGMENLAYFALGVSFSKQICMVFKEVFNVFMPKLVSIRLGFFNYSLVFIFGSVIGLIFYSFSDFFFAFLYGKEYLISSSYAKIIFCALGFYLTSTILTNEFKLNKNLEIKVIYIVNVLNPLFQVVATIIILFSSIKIELKLTLLVVLIAARDILRLLLIIFVNRLFNRYA